MSDHFDGQRFFNPTGRHGQPFSAVPRMLREARARWPDHVPVEPARPAPLDGASAVVTFIGHSTFLIQTAAVNILTDPMYSRRAGPVPVAAPVRVRLPAVRFDDLPRIDLVLLSHNHYDHCDLRTLARLAHRDVPLIVTPVGNAPLVRSAGVRHVEEIDWWQSSSRSLVSVTLTPAQHFSARTPFDRNRALWGGFVVSTGGVRLFFAGDTGYGPFFADIPRRLGAIDVALLPIGAYEPRWFMRDVHMNPAEAVQAHLDLESRLSIGMHYGTFQLTAEAIDDPPRALDAARRARAVDPAEFRTLAFGESVRV